MSCLLRIDAISKNFPGVKVLKEVSFSVEAGSIHALVGENGAGKSTLMQIVAGVQTPDGGRLIFDGQELHLTGPRDAQNKGIGIVFQELNLAPNMTVAENICLGVEPRIGNIFVDREQLKSNATEIMAQMGVAIDWNAKVGDLPIAQQQLIEICKALIHKPRLLIFDEPTSSLSEQETEFLFRAIADLKSQGVTMLYISHRMQEIFSLCDDVTVLRDGQHIRTMPLRETSQDEIVRLMVGRDLNEMACVHKPYAHRSKVLSVRHFTREPRYRDVSFDLYRGEIVGLAGLVGAGRSEMALGVFGAPGPDHGELQIDGKTVSITKPKEALQNGIGLVPEDRKHQGLFLGLGVGTNVSFSALPRITKRGMIDFSAERSLVESYVQRFQIKTPHTRQPVGFLSGGNQQKVVLAKWLATSPKVLIVDEPTRGVDVGSKAEIYALMRELAENGLAILMISSDLPEILTISDRILVMKEGNLVGEMLKDEATEEKIMALAALDQSVPRKAVSL